MCTITWEEFVKYIEEMKSLSDELHDGWLIRVKTDTENGAYITKKVVKEIRPREILTFEYHVVFNISYSVPKLCFNVFKTDGSLLRLEDVFDIFRFEKTDLLSILTQMDHPVLQTPFYTLHPCKTAELLQNAEMSKNPVISWLSAIGPTVNLNLLNEYSKLTN